MAEARAGAASADNLGGGGKGLLRIAAKYADYINVIPEAGKGGKISIEIVKRITDKSFREKDASSMMKRSGWDAIPSGAISNSSSPWPPPNRGRPPARRRRSMVRCRADPGRDPRVADDSHRDAGGMIVELKRRAKDWGKIL